jgi:hypothetical protein
MKYLITLIVALSISLAPSYGQFGNLIKKVEDAIGTGTNGVDVGAGLKEALEVGVSDAVSSLSATDGYLESPYKVLIPEEARAVTSKVSKVPGFKNIEEDLIKKMNEAAELAAKKAGPIFIDAIAEMSFKDATSILTGEEDAATRYLESSSRDALYDEFMPVIQAALDEVDARSLWNSAVSAYNKIPFSKKLNPELDDHVNQKALDGMFSLIEQKEEGIRSDVNLRTTPLLQEVFAQQDQD